MRRRLPEHFEGEICLLCKNPEPTGWWLGAESLYICSRCAIGTLPRLIADAALNDPAASPEAVFIEVTRAYWEAAASVAKTARRLA
jgi:hypothetical protein